jgi:hypothetical protein
MSQSNEARGIEANPRYSEKDIREKGKGKTPLRRRGGGGKKGLKAAQDKWRQPLSAACFTGSRQSVLFRGSWL